MQGNRHGNEKGGQPAHNGMSLETRTACIGKTTKRCFVLETTSCSLNKVEDYSKKLSMQNYLLVNVSERLWETEIKGELIQMEQTEQCWCMSLCESNQGGLYWDLNHDRVHPDYFLKGHEFASPYLVARDIIFILVSSIKSFLALSFGCQSDKKFRHM